MSILWYHDCSGKRNAPGKTAITINRREYFKQERSILLGSVLTEFSVRSLVSSTDCMSASLLTSNAPTYIGASGVFSLELQ